MSLPQWSECPLPQVMFLSLWNSSCEAVCSLPWILFLSSPLILTQGLNHQSLSISLCFSSSDMSKYFELLFFHIKTRIIEIYFFHDCTHNIYSAHIFKHQTLNYIVNLEYFKQNNKIKQIFYRQIIQLHIGIREVTIYKSLFYISIKLEFLFGEMR